MTSALAMTTGRRQSKLRLPTSIPPCDDDFALTGGSSGSPLITPNNTNDPLDKVFKLESKMDGDDNNNNNRSASAFLSKLLDDKHLYNDVEGSPSPTCHDSDSFVPSKSTSSRMSGHKFSASQRKNSRPTTSAARHKPAEVFRKDLISAMKIPDTSQLLSEEYWVMQDPWRIEWEKGVQVPVNPKSIPTKNVRIVPKETQGGFRMPRKMLKSSPEPGDKDMVDLNVLADSACRYDLDEMDVHWLDEINEERSLRGLMSLDEFSMEQIMEELETQCHENMQVAIQTKEGLGIEYDEDVVCDVCRMPDCEEGNEMVFCDGCNLCVHQACYGILKVPEGNWLCRPCSLGIRGSAVCILCDRKGGAMKSTRSGNKWAHVSCALWIPEISIADPERMEPITKVSHVPASRWALLCSICKERVGACIQCSVKHCVTAYHVTCAVEEKLDMIADCTDENAEDAVIFRSYCKKHSKNRKESISDHEKDEEEKRNLRQRRIMELEEEFFTLVKDEAVANALSVPVETVQEVMAYWKLKRKVNFDRALITPKHEEGTALAEAAETNLQRRLRMFTHLRQDLERVRNLCYMIGRREKTKRASVKNMESVFLTQMKLLERRMCHDTSFSTQRMASGLAKFGQPDVCLLAEQEWKQLSRHPEWMPVDVLAEEGKRQNSREIPEIESTPSPVDVTIKESPADKAVSAVEGGRQKNGLHRKAFLSACQRRESLGLKRTQGHAAAEQQEEEAKPRSAETRKRSLKPPNSDSDFESENKRPLAEKRLGKRAKTWSVWRTKNAGNSPSAFTVKTEPPKESESKDGHAEKSSRTRSSRLTARSNSAADGNVLGASPRQPPEPDLVVKWDSDKGDEPPELVTPKAMNTGLPNGQVAKRVAKTESNGTGKRPSPAQQLAPSPAAASSPSSVATRSAAKRNVRTVPARRAATEAKNEPGALARSCDSDVSAEVAVSRVQGLRKSPRTSPRNDASPPAARRKDVLVDTKNLPRPEDEEDGGYRGDMDESDSETAGPSVGRHKHTQPVSKRSSHAMQKRSARRRSDTAESSDYTLGEYDKTSMAKRRRLRSVHRLQNKPDAGEVRFKGYKDVVEDGQSPKPEGTAPSSEPAAEQTFKWPKNESAAGDACGEEVAVDGQQRPIAGGPTLPHSSQAPHPVGFPHAQFAGYPGEAPFFQHGFYPTACGSQVVLHPEVYYSNVYARGGASSGGDWTLTPKHKLIYAQQFSGAVLHQPPGLPLGHHPPPAQEQTSMQGHAVLPANLDRQPSPPPPPETHFNAGPAQLPPEEISQNVVQEEPRVHAKVHKKKKSKKSKRKKRKKERKRRESFTSVSNGSDSSDEYCVEYCSVLSQPRAEERASPPAPVETYSGVSDNCDAPLLNVPSREVELTQSGNDTLNTSGQTNNSSFVSSEQPTPPKQGGLLLKIDRKRLILPAVSDECDSSASSDAQSSSGNSDRPPEEPRPIVTPLKLKLSVQKSDRALRSGLMPRCYEILDESGVTEEHDARHSTESDQKQANAHQEVQSRPTRGQAALKRLGLLSDESKASPLVEKDAPADGVQTAVSGNSNPPVVNPPARKRGRPRKKPSPKGAQASIPAAETSAQKPVGNRSISTDTHTPFSDASIHHDSAPMRSRSHSDVIMSEMTSPSAGSATAQPERHWKKRKVKEHVDSVAVEPLPAQAPDPPSAHVRVTSPPVRHDQPEVAAPIQAPTSSPRRGIVDKPIIGNTGERPRPPKEEPVVTGSNQTAKAVSTTRTNSTPRSSPADNEGLSRPPPGKNVKKKSGGDALTDGKKTSSKSFQSPPIDGLPPVAPYRFTKANTHQQKMCNRASGSAPRDKSAAFNLIRARRKTEPTEQSATGKRPPAKADPYEFADFGS